jgi:hypothetical protein
LAKVALFSVGVNTGEINGWKAILNTLAMTYGDRLGLN